MMFVDLTDSELVYYIKQNKEEAYELLFLRYKTKMRYVIKKYRLDFAFNKDSGLVETIYYSALNEAINIYHYSKGLFSSFFEGIFKNQMISSSIIRKNIINIEVPSAYLEDVLQDNYDYLNNMEVNHLLKSLADYDYRCYTVISLWMQGVPYEEIGLKINGNFKVVAYLLRKGMKFLREIVS